jgi:hypothetical protein
MFLFFSRHCSDICLHTNNTWAPPPQKKNQKYKWRKINSKIQFISTDVTKLKSSYSEKEENPKHIQIYKISLESGYIHKPGIVQSPNQTIRLNYWKQHGPKTFSRKPSI